MTTYEVIDPLTGSRWEGDLKYLSRNLNVNALLCSVSEGGARTNLGLILHRDIVLFALQWAKSVNEDPIFQVLKCFELIEKWLEDEDSVTREELNIAARAADATARANAADAAAYTAARAAARAAYNAARAAARAADAASDARFAGYAAANAAAHAAYDANANAYASQGQMIVDYYVSSCANLSAA